MKGLLFFWLFLAAFTVNAQNAIKGKVVDAISNEPLVYVNISIQGSSKGTISDIEGKFRLDGFEKGDIIAFNYLGYEPHFLAITDSLLKFSHREIKIRLMQKSYHLKEVVITPGENPAYAIIRKTIENAPKNNPEKLPSFSYSSYNKFHFAPLHTDLDSIHPKDTIAQLLAEKAKSQHLFLTESVTRRNFSNGNSNEKVMASKVSGFKSHIFSLLATQFQSFSFYGDFIMVAEKKYPNPISRGSIGKYKFTLSETEIEGRDTIFYIGFEPRENKLFDGLKGRLAINSNGYALQEVMAQPAEEGTNTLKIYQKYEFIEERQWFPVKLNVDLIFKATTTPIVAIGRSYIYDISLNQVSKSKFSRIELDYSEDAHKMDEPFWQTQRKEPLTEQDLATYQKLDSIGKAERLDYRVEGLKALSTGRIPIGLFESELEKLINYNEYEGLRLGIALNTSPRISRKFILGGYFGYGFRDEEFKYGGDLKININEKKETELKLFSFYDLRESGGLNILLDRRPMVNEYYRDFLLDRMVYHKTNGGIFSFRPSKYLKMAISGNQSRITTTRGYEYGWDTPEGNSLISEFAITELGIGVRYAYKEKVARQPLFTSIIPSPYPTVWFQVRKGLNNYLGGNFDYLKFDLKVEQEIETKYYGRMFVQLLAGHVNNPLPYPMLFAGRGSIRGVTDRPAYKEWRLSVTNTFETMGVNEFLSSTYTSLFINHSLGSLKFSGSKFRPEIILVTAAGWGTISNPQSHYNVTYRAMDKGFYESGLRVNNVLKSAFTGIGIGFFYRYGPYTNPGFNQNFAAKLTANFAF
jgi:hypothetical protein